MFLRVGTKKKNGSLGLVQENWTLNTMTMKDTYPLLLIPYIFNKVSEVKVKYFTKLDVCWGYKNAWIKGDKWKAAFWMNQGLFKPLVSSLVSLMSGDVPDDGEKYLQRTHR